MSERSELIPCTSIIIYYKEFARSFLLHLLETSARSINLMHLTIVLVRSRKYGNNLFYAELYTVEKFTIGHIAAQHNWLNYITNKTHVQFYD